MRCVHSCVIRLPLESYMLCSIRHKGGKREKEGERERGRGGASYFACWENVSLAFLQTRSNHKVSGGLCLPS